MLGPHISFQLFSALRFHSMFLLQIGPLCSSVHVAQDMASSSGEGNGTPLQCSYLENPRDGGAWWAAVYGVAQSRTRLKQLSSSSISIYICMYIKRTDWWLSEVNGVIGGRGSRCLYICYYVE